jgi:EcsC protein family
MEQNDLARLSEAIELLENPSWAAQITNLIGMPIEWGMTQLPTRAGQAISNATRKAIGKGLEVAVSTMKKEQHGPSKKWWHRSAVALSGGVGGFFSLPGLAIELPISTIIMLRSIADIARSEDEDLRTIEAQLACIEVFALGGKKKSDDATETSYYAVRVALAKALSEVGEFIAERGLAEEGAPVILRFIAKIAARFEIIVSEKLASEIVPVIGAVGGATINLLFINHFQSMARGHFIVRNLERKYGEEIIRKEYERIAHPP